MRVVGGGVRGREKYINLIDEVFMVCSDNSIKKLSFLVGLLTLVTPISGLHGAELKIVAVFVSEQLVATACSR